MNPLKQYICETWPNSSPLVLRSEKCKNHRDPSLRCKQFQQLVKSLYWSSWYSLVIQSESFFWVVSVAVLFLPWAVKHHWRHDRCEVSECYKQTWIQVILRLAQVMIEVFLCKAFRSQHIQSECINTLENRGMPGGFSPKSAFGGWNCCPVKVQYSLLKMITSPA